MENGKIKVGDKVACNGYPGTIVRTRDCPDSAWLGRMVEIRLARGIICTAEYLRHDASPNKAEG
jgi:hypothetical protein